jgi:hypothetical protein
MCRMTHREEEVATMRHEGGAKVRSGFYWNLSRWTIVTIPKEGGLLPGGPEHRYLKLPVLVLLAVAPVMGGLYVMFLPFIGFAMVAATAGRKAGAVLAKTFVATMATVSPSWHPGEAYFTGKPRPRSEGERKEEERNAAR